MLTYATRPTSNPHSFSTQAVLSICLGLFCWMGMVTANGFTFKDFGPNTKAPIISPDQIKAVGALLIDGSTGEVLYARNPDKRLLPASTTKLMTALIVYEKLGGLNGSVTITDDDTKVEPSSVPLIPGETVSVDKLFHALLIESANDSARALGRHVAGSTDAFIDMMNQRALTLGCFNTHFNNPNGLPAPAGTHYTTCADLMRIFRAVIAHRELREICSTKEYVLKTAAKTQTLRNHNRLLGYYPGMGAAKTGWTIASRHTYAAAVKLNGRELLLTILNSPDKWFDAQVLLNWGFSQPYTPSTAGKTAPPAATAAPTPEPAPSGMASSVTTTPPAPAKKKAKRHPVTNTP